MKFAGYSFYKDIPFFNDLYLISMKKILSAFVIVLAIFSVKHVNAQFNYFGGGIALSTTNSGYEFNKYEFFNNTFGIDLRLNYDYSKKLQIVTDLKIYLPNKESLAYESSTKTTVFAFNVNGHFILNPKTRESYRLYLLGGVHISGWNIVDQRETPIETYDDKIFKFVPGGNVGAGMQFEMANRLLFFAEAKYVISKSYQLVFTPGILYNF